MLGLFNRSSAIVLEFWLSLELPGVIDPSLWV